MHAHKQNKNNINMLSTDYVDLQFLTLLYQYIYKLLWKCFFNGIKII